MYKLYSQRKKEAAGEIPDVYEYTVFPESFRNQYVYIVSDIFKEVNKSSRLHGKSDNIWDITCELFAREKGLKGISGNSTYCNTENAYAYIDYVDACNDEDFLDLLDFTVSYIICNEISSLYIGNKAIDHAISELNYRFSQHSLGYEIINGKLITKTDEHIHTNIVKPAFALLHQEEFRGAEDEFMLAWKHYKDRNFKDAILNAGKSFESVMKSICKHLNIQFNEQSDDAKKLILILRQNNFFPAYLESHMNGIRATLESGAPTVRNKIAGHGQGDEVKEISEAFASYALNLVATNIMFLGKIYVERRDKNDPTNKATN